MGLRNSKERYGWLSVAIHWLCAVTIFSLFGVGLWMMDLDYYSDWYRIAPHWHKSIGVLLIAVMCFRLVWRFLNIKPAPLADHKRWETNLAKITHVALYILVLLMFPTGYLITTAKGQGLDVFNWFTIPATVTGIDNLEDIAGEIHEILGFVIVGLALLHALGALKHHFIDKDATLKRMLGR